MADMFGKPLNGNKTHPLKTASIAVLEELNKNPVPAYTINPGVKDRLGRQGLTTIEEGKTSRMLTITDKGRKWLADRASIPSSVEVEK